MAEWLKARAWKARIPQGIQGSNPCLSAIPQNPFVSGDSSACDTFPGVDLFRSRIRAAEILFGYLYDAEGHRTAKGTISYWSCDTDSTQSDYNGFQLTTTYIIGQGGEPLTESSIDPATGNSTWVHTDAYAGAALVATYDNKTSQQPLHFQWSDWLGSRRVQTDVSGNIEETCSNLPFGNTLNCTNPAGAPTTADDATEQHFTGKERDTESGLDYFGARYYQSNMGRWMSPDWADKPEAVPYAKLDNPQSLNLYSYVLNNPLSGVDADGHQCASLSASCSAGEHQALENQAANSPYRLTVKEDYVDGYRYTTYQVQKLDANGNLSPLNSAAGDPAFHVMEHQTDQNLKGTTSVGNESRSTDSVDEHENLRPEGSYEPTTNEFHDALGPGIPQPDTHSGQSFSISTTPGINPSYSQPILVRIPGSNGPGQSGDHGVMDIHITRSGVTINGQSKLPIYKPGVQ